jgi:hypothetical protein
VRGLGCALFKIGRDSRFGALTCLRAQIIRPRLPEKSRSVRALRSALRPF